MTVKNVERLEKSLVSLEIEVDAEEFETAVSKAYLKARGNLKVPGFRPGKATRKMIEQLYGAEVFYSDAVDLAFPDAYDAAVKSENLNVIDYPKVELVGEVTKDGFTFKATAPVFPEIKLGQYKGLSAPKGDSAVSDDEVTEHLNRIAERNARLVSVEREAKTGDLAVIDFEGFLDGVPFAGGKGENHELELGSGSFVPGFEDQVVGMKAGEEKDITVTFPVDYTPDLAGKTVVFHVKCNEVKFKELPELDDDFAKDVSEFDTIEELRADTRKQLETQRQSMVDAAFQNALLGKVADGIEAEIPDVMVDRQCRHFLDEFKARLAEQGVPYERYVEFSGMSEAKFLADRREDALMQVKVSLAIGEIVKAEKLEASEDEIKAEYQRLAEELFPNAENIKDYFSEEYVRDSVRNKKAVAVVVDSAVVEEASAEPLEESAEQAES